MKRKMAESMEQNEIPELSKKTKEISDINNSQVYQNKEVNPFDITKDLLPDVRKNYFIIKN